MLKRVYDSVMNFLDKPVVRGHEGFRRGHALTFGILAAEAVAATVTMTGPSEATAEKAPTPTMTQEEAHWTGSVALGHEVGFAPESTNNPSAWQQPTGLVEIPLR